MATEQVEKQVTWQFNRQERGDRTIEQAKKK